MTLNMQKLNAVEGSKIGSIVVNDTIRGVATIAADGYQKLVGYMSNTGKWLWIHKDFRK